MRIAIFAREPIPGRTKTRLAASIGADAACALHRAFVLDTLAHCRAVPGLEPEIHGADPGPFLASLGVPVVPQREGDLGVRMAHALGRAPLVVGADAPTLPRAILVQAIDALARADVVLTPAADGGYVLIGARRGPTALLCSSLDRPVARPLDGPLDPPIGQAIRWSSPHALADTVRAARAQGLSIALTAPHHDVDTADDLRLLRAHLAHDPGAAPHTASAIGNLWPENHDF